MLRNMSSACDDMDVTLAQLHMVPEMVSLGGGARLCKHAAQEPSCPGTPTQPREAPPTPAHYGYDAPSPVGDEAGGCSCSSYSASVPSTASSSPASSTAAAAAAAGHIASLSNSLGTATAAEAHCAAGADLAADLELRGSGRGGAAAAIRPGEYHQSDAAVSLRHVLARQRRMAVAAVAAAAPQQPHAAVQCDNPEQQTPEQQLAERFRRERQELLQQQHQNRSVVVSWMAEVSTAFRLSSATLSLAVELYDCYMAKQTKPVPNSMLQLLALTCLKVACSMEEVSGLRVAAVASVA
ncbi:cell division [Pleodorina starrii]|uniref:Cell division n=1 Tax=Pleodorina starrii TaxID=330485 RepID=A0A9W6BJP6_9CHLO|nr:cell division [Pleodorina starrii]